MSTLILEILHGISTDRDDRVLIALAVYVVGGIAYQRTVMHQRGWKQFPNYSLWAGIFGFVKVSMENVLHFLHLRRYNRIAVSSLSYLPKTMYTA